MLSLIGVKISTNAQKVFTHAQEEENASILLEASSVTAKEVWYRQNNFYSKYVEQI